MEPHINDYYLGRKVVDFSRSEIRLPQILLKRVLRRNPGVERVIFAARIEPEQGCVELFDHKVPVDFKKHVNYQDVYMQDGVIRLNKEFSSFLESPSRVYLAGQIDSIAIYNSKRFDPKSHRIVRPDVFVEV